MYGSSCLRKGREQASTVQQKCRNVRTDTISSGTWTRERGKSTKVACTIQYRHLEQHRLSSGGHEMSGKLEQIFEKVEETETSQKQRLCYGSLCSRGVAGCSSKVLFKNLYVKERRTILPTWARNGEECSAGGGEGTDDGGSCKIWRLGQELHAFQISWHRFQHEFHLKLLFRKTKKKQFPDAVKFGSSAQHCTTRLIPLCRNSGSQRR